MDFVFFIYSEQYAEYRYCAYRVIRCHMNHPNKDNIETINSDIKRPTSISRSATSSAFCAPYKLTRYSASGVENVGKSPGCVSHKRVRSAEDTRIHKPAREIWIALLI